MKLKGEVAIKAQAMLLDICSCLDLFDVRYSLDAGTLLGVVREGRLLPWDNDMDLAILSAEWSRYESATKSIRDKGYEVTMRYNKIEFGPIRPGSPRISKITRDGLTLDMFVKHSDGQKVYWVESGRQIVKAVDASHYEKYEKVHFMNSIFSIPHNTDQYLTSRYGDWRTPVKKYNYKKDDLAIIGSISPADKE